MRAEMSRGGTPGAQLAVVQGDRIVYTRGYGVADVESGRPVTEKTLFQVGSVSKLTTAMLLTQLSAEGKIDLGAPISRYVPELAGKRVGTVTGHQLLSMTGGWANISAPNANLDEGRLAETIRRQTDEALFTDPGAVYSYSNAGYTVLGYIAESVVGRPFATVRDSVVLRGLGMPRATSRPLVAMTHDFSVGHAGRGGNPPTVVRPMPDNGAERAAGFLWASAAEIARIALALMNDGVVDGKQVFNAAAMRSITTGHVAYPSSTTSRAGYWLIVGNADGRREWYGSGGVAGYQTTIRIWPDQKLAVIVTTNAQTTPISPAATQAIGAFIGGFKVASPIVYAPERDPTAKERTELAGRYGEGPRTAFTMVESGGVLELQIAAFRYPVRLTNAGDRIVIKRPATDDIVYVILRDASGNVKYLHSNGRAFTKNP